MSEAIKICPICPRSCHLSKPACSRGQEYAKTGQLPSGHESKRKQRLSFEKKEEQLIMKYLHHAVGAVDYGGITQEQAKDMFSVLSEEETLYLAELLEKLSDYWIQIAPKRPSHHNKG